jgi:hypothetical protein
MVLIYIFGKYVGADVILNRFRLIDKNSVTVTNIISGEAINRKYTMNLGIQRLKESSWLIGYGYGNAIANRDAFSGMRSIDFNDFHCLYLELPVIYGWFGAAAFLFLILLTLFRLIRCYRAHPKYSDYLMPFILGFIIFWMVFLLNEYKISIFRALNYHMLFWIWLGLSNAIIKNMENNIKLKMAAIA